MDGSKKTIMPRYGARSRGRLATAHPDLQEVYNEAIKWFDITILEGERGEDRQYLFYLKGTSKVKYPNSKHNKIPSEAICAAPYPIDWDDRERFYYMAGLIIGIAKMKGIELRWGGDWKRNNKFNKDTPEKERFDDLGHIELI